jgi:hypothetical protein
MNRKELIKEFKRTLDAIDLQIALIEQECEERGFPARKLRDDRGSFILSPLLLAKAQALHGLALLGA